MPRRSGDEPPSSGLRGRLPALGRRLLRGDRAIALFDQGALGLARIIALVLFARIMPTEQFGAFALVLSIGFMASTLQRAVVVLPFIMACREPENAAEAARAWSWIALLTALLSALVLALAWSGCLMLSTDPWLATAIAVSAMATPFSMAYTFLRRLAYQMKDLRAVTVMVVVNALAYAVGIPAAVLARDIGGLPFLVIVLAPAASATVGIVKMAGYLKPRPHGLWQTFRNSLPLSRWSFFASLAASFYTNGMNLIIAGVIGPAGAAVFTVTRTLVSPAGSVTVANDMVDKPRAGRAFAAAGHRGLRRSTSNTMVFLVALGGPYLLLVALFAEPLLHLVYGDKYVGTATELRLWALVMMLTLLTNPLATYLVTVRDTRSIFQANLIGAVVAILVSLPLLYRFGIAAALVAMALGRLVNIGLLALAAWRSHQGSDDRSAPP